MSAVKKLKCGGKIKAKGKYLDGGQVSPLSEVPEEIVKIITEMLDNKRNALVDNLSYRDNPASVLKKANALDTGSSVISGAGKGAALGTAIAPGIGTAIGAGVGALTSGIGRLFGSKDRKEDIARATSTWSDSYSSKTAGALCAYGYKKGGEIKGPGTGKSDSVSMTAEDGSFIVPAENAEYAKELGRSFLGWDDSETASKSKGNVNIKASDGEIIFNPREVAVLKYHGVDLDSLAPKAENSKKTNKMTKGGPVKEDDKNKDISDWKYDPKSKLVMSQSGNIAYDGDGNEYKINSDTNRLEKTGEKSPYGSAIYGEYDQSESALDLLPELLGAAQVAGGAAGLIAAGRAPDMRVSNTLKRLSGETRRLAEFGYEPKVLNALNAEIDKTRADMTRLVSESGSTSGLEKMAQMQNILGTTIDKKAQLSFADAAEKARKFSDVISVDTALAGQEFDISKMKVEDWYRNQDVMANLAIAGISNIVGARQLKAEQDALKKIGDTGITFKR